MYIHIRRRASYPCWGFSASGDTTPCRITGVTLHSHVHYKEIYARTCSGPLRSSVKPHDVNAGAVSAVLLVGGRARLETALYPHSTQMTYVLSVGAVAARDVPLLLVRAGAALRDRHQDD